jgi:hypothetical protein
MSQHSTFFPDTDVGNFRGSLLSKEAEKESVSSTTSKFGKNVVAEFSSSLNVFVRLFVGGQSVVPVTRLCVRRKFQYSDISGLQGPVVQMFSILHRAQCR